MSDETSVEEVSTRPAIQSVVASTVSVLVFAVGPSLAQKPAPGGACCDLSGPEFHERLSETGLTLPVAYLTSHGDVPLSVRSMKKGAVDFLLKPVDDEPR